MTKTLVKPRVSTKTTTQRPPLYKVILLNDDFTPREFVVAVLKAVFRMGAERAYAVMMTAHRKGACVIAVYTRDVAEAKAKEADRTRQAERLPAVFHDREGIGNASHRHRVVATIAEEQLFNRARICIFYWAISEAPTQDSRLWRTSNWVQIQACDGGRLSECRRRHHGVSLSLRRRSGRGGAGGGRADCRRALRDHQQPVGNRGCRVARHSDFRASIWSMTSRRSRYRCRT